MGQTESSAEAPRLDLPAALAAASSNQAPLSPSAGRRVQTDVDEELYKPGAGPELEREYSESVDELLAAADGEVAAAEDFRRQGAKVLQSPSSDESSTAVAGRAERSSPPPPPPPPSATLSSRGLAPPALLVLASPEVTVFLNLREHSRLPRLCRALRSVLLSRESLRCPRRVLGFSERRREKGKRENNGGGGDKGSGVVGEKAKRTQPCTGVLNSAQLLSIRRGLCPGARMRLPLWELVIGSSSSSSLSLAGPAASPGMSYESLVSCREVLPTSSPSPSPPGSPSPGPRSGGGDGSSDNNSNGDYGSSNGSGSRRDRRRPSAVEREERAFAVFQEHKSGTEGEVFRDVGR